MKKMFTNFLMKFIGAFLAIFFLNQTASAQTTWYLDFDNDTYHVKDSVSLLSPGAGWDSTGTTTLGDCNDFDPTVHLQAYWFLDNDADGYYTDSSLSCNKPSPSYTQTITAFGDCNDNDSSVYVFQTWFLDIDGDGLYTRDSFSCNSPSSPAWNLTATSLGDCDDNNPLPLASLKILAYWDNDGDTYGRPDSSLFVCPGTPNYTANNTDCNDNSALAFFSSNYYRDVDQDSWAADTNTLSFCSNGVFKPGYVLKSSSLGLDCNDNNATKFQSASLFYDFDNDGWSRDTFATVLCFGLSIPPYYISTSSGVDCNDIIDTINAPLSAKYIDQDGDGFGVGSILYFCSNPGLGYADVNGDCDDSVATVFPKVWFVDTDGDGRGQTTSVPVPICALGNILLGYSLDSTDCNDANGLVYRLVTLYIDADGDGYSSGGTFSCIGDTISLPLGTDTLSIGIDCNDNDSDIWRTANTFIDQDGDGLTTTSASVLLCYGANLPSGSVSTSNGIDCDDNTTDAALSVPVIYYIDADGDGYGVGNGTSYCPGQAPTTGVSLNNIDCNDSTASVWRNGVFFADADGDNYTLGSSVVCYGANTPTGYKTAASANYDCNDANSAINPGATEVPNNGIDEDCNGSDLTTGIEDLVATVASVYPNPGANFAVITVNGNWNASLDVAIRDIEGRVVSVQTLDVKGNNVTVNTQTLSSGMYVITVKDARSTATVRWMKN